MWWSEWPSRGTNIPVDIDNSDGQIRVYINQLENAGQWNSLGVYTFDSGIDYNVTIISQRYPSSTCADAVRFVNVLAPPNYPPEANDDSFNIDENSTDNFLDVLANDSDPDPGDTLTITDVGTPDQGGSVLINSTSDGLIYTPASEFVGAETFTYTIKDSGGAIDQATVTTTVSAGIIETEHIYVCYVYAHWIPNLEAALQDMGAQQQNPDLWRYVNPDLNKEFLIHIVRDLDGMIQAFKTEEHIIIAGHANYGIGPVPATPQEKSQGYVEDILYIDDPRILNISSPIFSVSLSGLIQSQAYPNWRPIYQDGTSGVMSFGFNSPKGDPPYNYYITYQLPGDPNHYKVETVHFSALERFPGCGSTPWYSITGASPNPDNPAHRQYFITLPSFFDIYGSWIQSQSLPGAYGGGHHYLPAGLGDNTASWNFQIDEPDDYKIYAWWPSSPDNALEAHYTVSHSGGETTFIQNQTTNGTQWNEIGEFYYDEGDFSVHVTDESIAGNVAADAVRVVRTGNIPEEDVIKANFYARNRFGDAPLTVRFSDCSLGDVTERLWEFGDGTQDSLNNNPEHTYTNPGIYTVSLTVSGPSGSDTEAEVDYIYVDQSTPPLQAEFQVRTEQDFDVPYEVEFRDRSLGDVVSWQWNFGDSGTSSLERPKHTYTTPGIYTVSLTVTDSNGHTSTETKENLIRASIYDKRIDDVIPTKHYGNRTCLIRREDDIPKEEMKFRRMFYDSCNSGVYYLDTIGRGIVFYTVVSADASGHLLYLKGYMEGKSDQELWAIVQDHDPGKYDYYNFNQLPGILSAAISPLSTASIPKVIKPAGDKTFSPEKEARISQLRYFSLEETFQELRDVAFLLDKDYLHKAIFTAFTDRKMGAISYTLDYLEHPEKAVIEGESVLQPSGFHVAKEILRAFSDDALPALVRLYYSARPPIKRNVIRVLGRMPGEQVVRNLLIKALEDKSICQEEDDDVAGDPLRICDEAYNQLVLRYMIENVLRTIGPVHRIEVRDYHINRLKGILIPDPELRKKLDENIRINSR
jgi:PKD repeat protein